MPARYDRTVCIAVTQCGRCAIPAHEAHEAHFQLLLSFVFFVSGLRNSMNRLLYKSRILRCFFCSYLIHR